MKKLLIILLCLLPSTAFAQKTKAALITELGTNLATGSNITAATMRATLTDMINSWYDFNGGSSGACATNQFVNSYPSLSSFACAQPTPANLGTGTFSIAVLSSLATGGVGYTAGAGGAVTQLTSRTTGVTLNTVTGAITLFTAAGSATAATFTVTDSAVAATDVVHISEKSGTNLYNTLVTAVAAGSFNVTFFTTGGTASDAPVFNFTVIKGSAN